MSVICSISYANDILGVTNTTENRAPPARQALTGSTRAWNARQDGKPEMGSHAGAP